MTKKIDWTKFKVRCSALSQVMSDSKSNPCITEKQAEKLKDYQSRAKLTDNQRQELDDLLKKQENSKKVVLSDSCISYLTEAYALITAQKLSITKEMDIDSLRRGRLSEPESIMALSFVDNVPYEKNEIRVENEWLTGLPDIFTGEDITRAEKIVDVKSIWDYPLFLYKETQEVVSSNRQQLAGYAWITGAREAFVANVLVDMPEEIRNDYKRRLFYRMNALTDESPEYKIAVANMEQSMMFGDIPVHMRVSKKQVELFSDFEKEAIKARVAVCREWLVAYDAQKQAKLAQIQVS